MIASIRLRGVGPVEELLADIDPRGHVTFAGPSMSGKSTTTRAILGLWTGEAPEVRDGAEKAEITVITGGGTTLATTVTPSGSWTRFVQKKGEPKPTRPGSHAEFASWCPAAAYPDLVRAIAYPRVWESLYTSELGRPLRDLLMRVLPPADLQGRIRAKMKEAGLGVADSDLAVSVKAGTRFVPLPAADPDYPMLLVKKLKAAQTEANQVLKTADALLLAGLQRMEKAKSEKVDAPTKDGIEAADATLAGVRAWEAYDTAHRTWKLADDVRAAKETERAGWRARKAALGDRPVVDAEARQAARLKVERLQAEVDTAKLAEAAAKARAEAEARAETERLAQAERAADAALLAEARRSEDEARHAKELEAARLAAAQVPAGRSLPMFGGGVAAASAPVAPPAPASAPTSPTMAPTSPVAVAAARLAERAEYDVIDHPKRDGVGILVRRTADGTETEIGRDGGEPEDNSFVRDWDWVAPALQAVEDRANEDRAALLAEIQRLTAELAARPVRVAK